MTPCDQQSYNADVVRINVLDTDGLTSWTPEEDKE
jgi:hypothetical protein